MTSASRWTVAPDGGRPEGRGCVHLGAMSAPSDPLPESCEECSALGLGWMRLRWCTTCGHVGCCDSSRGRHAYSHHVATGHPLVLSLAPDEHWAWCYVDELFLIRAPATRGSDARPIGDNAGRKARNPSRIAMNDAAEVGRERPTESVYSYPRPPRVEPDTRRVTVRCRGVTLADSVRALRVLETSHPPVFYLPREDVRIDRLSRSATESFCEWKGAATYWSLTADGVLLPDVAWSYEAPAPRYGLLAGHVAFYPGRVDCTVDGERVSPQPGHFYGGWITAEIVGPFKGGPPS